ncbi:MAG: hypothetical protein V1781_01010 [Bacteroidota bacterium]
MKIIFINRDDTKIDYCTEPDYLHPLVLIADTVKYISMIVHTIVTYKGIEKLTDDSVVQMHKDIFKKDENAIQMHKETDRIYSIVKKVKNIKHKDKNTLIYIHSFESLIKIFKKNIKEQIEDILKGICIYEIMPFIQDEVFKVQESCCYSEETKCEDPYINLIADIIITNENIFLFDTQIEKILSSETDFIKIPLWDFPPLAYLTYNQMKYTRENLKSALHQFKVQLKEISSELFKITFASENFLYIEKLCADKLNPHIASLQKSINESIYISQTRNKFPENHKMKLYLGITSVENLVNYYEKMNIVFPYVANEIKEQVKRHIDIKMTCPFFYFEMNVPEYKD